MKKFLVIIAVVLLVLSGCNAKENDAMVVCGTYAVPGFIVRDMKGKTYTCNKLEEDSRGRILYEFSSKNIITGEWETALVICQGYDHEFVYYFEDRCYGLYNYDESSVIQLKKQNDWDEPMDYDKMSRREIVISVDAYVMIQPEFKITDVLTSCQKKIKDSRISIQDMHFVDSDGSGHEIYYFTIEDNSKSYFALVSRESEVSLLEVNKPFDASAYTAFKQQNNWVYGY